MACEMPFAQHVIVMMPQRLLPVVILLVRRLARAALLQPRSTLAAAATEDRAMMRCAQSLPRKLMQGGTAKEMRLGRLLVRSVRPLHSPNQSARASHAYRLAVPALNSFCAPKLGRSSTCRWARR